jgi:sterol desaturase/sphingolipid hydroxylase (fatty acid hydroxylase superfamily)
MLNDYLTYIFLELAGIDWPTLGTIEFTGESVAFGLLLCFVGFAILEHRFPYFKRPVKQTRQSYRTNISLFTFNSIMMSACSASALFIVAERYSRNGLLQGISDPTMRFLLAFLAMDLLLYAWHRACHHYDSLWMFHRVHHNDPSLNTSTAFRLHFLEIISTNCLKALLIVVLGIDKVVFLVIEMITTLSIMFHHTNITFKLEYIVSEFIIVPALHRVHHSTERSEHDRNYGAVLSLWDRLFGTQLTVEPKAIGIKGRSPQTFLPLIRFGLGIGMNPEPQVNPANLDAMIAEAAYYIAEKRNFNPGYDMRDWLEAKKQIISQVSGKKHDGDNFLGQGFINSLKITLSAINRTMQQTLKNVIFSG